MKLWILSIVGVFVTSIGLSQTTKNTLASATLVNYPPTADPKLVSLTNLQPVIVSLTGYDADGDTLTFNIVAPPSLGTLTQFNPASGQATYVPPSQSFGIDSFTFSVTDGIATSGPATVTVSGPPPAIPVLISPANGSTGVSLAPSLSWSAANGASSYDVYFGASSAPPLVTNMGGTSYSPGPLSAATTYYWQIVAKNSSGTAGSSVWSFTTRTSVTQGASKVGAYSAGYWVWTRMAILPGMDPASTS
jgi:hypothetical protein